MEYKENEILNIYNKVTALKYSTLYKYFSEQTLTSLQSVAISMMLKNIGITISPVELLKCKSLSDLKAATVNVAITALEMPIEQVIKSFEFTPTQKYWQEGGFGKHYNIYSAWELEGEIINLKLLESAITLLIQNNLELSLKIYYENGQLKQAILKDKQPQILEKVDLSELKPTAAREEMLRMTQNIQYSFEFKKSQPLYRFIIFDYGSNANPVLFVLLHHYLTAARQGETKSRSSSLR